MKYREELPNPIFLNHEANVAFEVLSETAKKIKVDMTDSDWSNFKNVNIIEIDPTITDYLVNEKLIKSLSIGDVGKFQFRFKPTNKNRSIFKEIYKEDIGYSLHSDAEYCVTIEFTKGNVEVFQDVINGLNVTERYWLLQLSYEGHLKFFNIIEEIRCQIKAYRAKNQDYRAFLVQSAASVSFYLLTAMYILAENYYELVDAEEFFSESLNKTKSKKKAQKIRNKIAKKKNISYLRRPKPIQVTVDEILELDTPKLNPVTPKEPSVPTGRKMPEHSRKEHYRRVRCGKGRSQVKWVKISGCTVNKGKGKKNVVLTGSEREVSNLVEAINNNGIIDRTLPTNLEE